VNVEFAEIASVVLEILKNYNIVQKIMSNRQRIQRYGISSDGIWLGSLQEEKNDRMYP
jgi:hypothetical protein